jgi:putative membrane protein
MIAGSSKTEDKQETAIDILKMKYAKGEISKEEFEKIKQDLIKE